MIIKKLRHRPHLAITVCAVPCTKIFDIWCRDVSALRRTRAVCCDFSHSYKIYSMHIYFLTCNASGKSDTAVGSSLTRRVTSLCKAGISLNLYYQNSLYKNHHLHVLLSISKMSSDVIITICNSVAIHYHMTRYHVIFGKV